MDERIGLSVVAGDEAEALGGIEELDGPGRLLAGQLAHRGALARRLLDRERIALDLQVGRRHATAAVDQGELERLSFGEPGQAGLLDCGNMDEYVLTAVVPHNEAEALVRVEELYDA